MSEGNALLIGRPAIMVLNAGRGTTPACHESKFTRGDIVRVRRLAHLKHLPERAVVAVVVPPNFPADYAMADARGEPRPLMVGVPYRTVAYILAFEDNRKPFLIKEQDLLPTGERAEVTIEQADAPAAVRTATSYL